MEEDHFLFDWARHFAPLLAMFALVGGLGGALSHALVPHRSEAWTIVLEPRSIIAARQLGPVAETVFRSSAVYLPAMQELGITESPERFLAERVELRPIPETHALIVIGKAEDPGRAKALSGAMAESLVAAFQTAAGVESVRILSGPELAPVSGRLSVSVAGALGAAASLWLGLGFAVMAFRRRRPILALERAISVTAARRVTVLDSGRRRWLGALGRRLTWRDTARNRRALSHLAAMSRNGSTARVVAPGRERQEGHIARALAYTADIRVTVGPFDGRDEWGVEIMVCDPWTPEAALRVRRSIIEAGGAAEDTELVWVA
jgi:hypothetical protein